jgi:nitrite reductase/ring-hydroxylating ferredoxin subunit
MPLLLPYKLYPYPEGWYAIAFSSELAKGQLLIRPFMDKEVTLFRTELGVACATESYCPHMGAHFRHGGTVEGETIRCQFHGFCFDTKGDCVATGYGTKPKHEDKLHIYCLQEKNGIVLIYHSPAGNEPMWDVPTLNMNSYTSLRYSMWELDSHLQGTLESIIDMGQLRAVNGYSKVDILAQIKTIGPNLYCKYSTTRKTNFAGLYLSKVKTNVEVHLHGLGYSYVQTEVPQYGMRLRQFVLSTPVGDNKIHLRIALAIEYLQKPSKILPMLALAPRKLVTKLVAKSLFKALKNDVNQNLKFWKNKVQVQSPDLTVGNGLVEQYRVWAKQFYPKDGKPDLMAKNS